MLKRKLDHEEEEERDVPMSEAKRARLDEGQRVASALRLLVTGFPPFEIAPAPPSLSDLRAKRARIQEELDAIQAQLDVHPEAMRDLIGNQEIADALVPRLTLLKVVQGGTPWNDHPATDYPVVHLCLDGVHFAFSDKYSHSYVRGLYSVDVYAREDEETRQKRMRRKKNRHLRNAVELSWPVRYLMEDPYVSGTEEEKTQQLKEKRHSFQSIYQSLRRDFDMPRRDIEASIVAYAVLKHHAK